MNLFKLKNVSLDSYETNNLIKTSFGSKSDEHIEDNLVNNRFDFVRCYDKALQKDEFGAFLILTGKQYIFAKCYDDGEQGHMISVAKTFLELEDKNSDISVIKSSDIYREYAKKFLILEFEIKKDEVSRKRDKIIRLDLNHNKISNEEYESFKLFFDEYSDVISKCNFDFSIWDRLSGKILPIKTIYQLDEFLKNNIDENTKAPQLEKGEKIVGIPINNQNFNKML